MLVVFFNYFFYIKVFVLGITMLTYQLDGHLK